MKTNTFKKIKFLLFFVILLFSFLGTKSDAASINISTSKSSVSPGESFTVTVSVSNGAGSVTTTVSNGSGGMTDFLDNSSYSFTCTAGSSGTVNITASGTVADYTTEQDENPSASASVSIVASSGDSGNSGNSGSGDSGSSDSGNSGGGTTVSAPTLSNLGIRPYDFTGFRSGTTSYSVTVPNDCKSVTIYATSNNGEISGTGAVTLKEGTNKFNVTVSNSAGSKTYTLSIIRQTQDSEVIPNTIEGEEPENNSEGIGLTGLRITGYTFEEEFQTGTYEYTVKIPEGLSESKLEEIKNSITAITNDDKVSVEIQTTLNEDGSAVITLVVKDDEKEYSTYKINFIIDKEAVNNESSEKSEKTSAVAGTTKSNNSQGKTAVEEITRKMLILLICMVAIILIAVYYAISSYIKSKRSPKDKKDYFNDDEYEDQNNLISSIYAETNGKPLDYKKLTNSDEDKIEENKDMKSRISEMLKDDNKIPEFSGASENKDEIENKKSSIFDEEEKSENIGGYRKPRRGFGSGGKH